MPVDLKKETKLVLGCRTYPHHPAFTCLPDTSQCRKHWYTAQEVIHPQHGLDHTRLVLQKRNLVLNGCSIVRALRGV